MGSSAAERLAVSGFNVVIWNRTSEKAEALARKIGVSSVGSLEEALQSASYAISFLSDNDAVLEVTSGIPKAEGPVYIEMSTITPRTSRLINERLQSKGVCFVHSPVLGYPQMLKDGKAIILGAGDRECWNPAQTVLNALSQNIVYLGGDPGMAAAVKLAFNNILVTAVGAAAESLALVEAQGVDPKTFIDILSKTIFSRFATIYMNRKTVEGSKTHFALKLSTKDIDYFTRTMRETGIPAFIAAAATQAFTAATVLGLGNADFTRIIDLLRTITGKKVGSKPKTKLH